MGTKILALDLGTTTGWALAADDKIKSGAVQLKATRFQSADRRFFNFKKFLLEKYREVEYSVVYYESVRRHLGVDAAHLYGGFKAILSEFCIENNIPFEGVAVGTIKKHATGKGNASKAQMIESARNRGHYPEDDNEADAIAIVYYAMENES